MPVVAIDGVRLLVEESGSGIPSFSCTEAGTTGECGSSSRTTARRFRVISYDRRGHTGSEDGTEPGTRRDDEDDLADLVEMLGLAPAIVVGNSFGGSIALGLAARRPELFRTLRAHGPPLMALAADDPPVAQVGEAIGPVLELIERGEAEAAARRRQLLAHCWSRCDTLGCGRRGFGSGTLRGSCRAGWTRGGEHAQEQA